MSVRVSDFVHEVSTSGAVEAAGEEGVGDVLFFNLGGDGGVHGEKFHGAVVRGGRDEDMVVGEIFFGEVCAAQLAFKVVPGVAHVPA